MFCSKCGKQLPDDVKFCFNCGAPVSVPESEVKNEVATKATLTDQPVAETPIKETPTRQEFSEKQPKKQEKASAIGDYRSIAHSDHLDRYSFHPSIFKR